MSGVSGWSVALAVVGALIVVATLADLFVTVFNYDGFSFIASRMHHLLWKTMRTVARVLPERLRHATLSLASAAMLPATYLLWLGLLITGFALVFHAALQAHDFSSKSGHGIGTAFYLSAGDLTSLTFGDVSPRSPLTRALVDVETAIGLTTFTLALGYLVTTFDVLRTLDGLHAIVRRHAEDPAKPSSILARHFRGGEATELPSLLGSISDKLENYDEGLRRYPVVYYFHTRRLQRSIPQIFTDLGRLLALLRWGLPAKQPMTEDPLLVALVDEYGTTLERLQRSFVGPPDLDPPDPVTAEEFAHQYAAAIDGREGTDHNVAAFVELQRAARSSAGITDDSTEGAYDQYRRWLPFSYRNRVILGRIADALGYEIPYAPDAFAHG